MSYSIQATSTPSIFHQADQQDARMYSHDSSNANVHIDKWLSNTNNSEMISKKKPEPLNLMNDNSISGNSFSNLYFDYGDEDISTPKVLTSSRSSSRRSSRVSNSGTTVFFMSDIHDTQPNSPERKNKIEKAIKSGSGYLQIPSSVERRRHSWMSG